MNRPLRHVVIAALLMFLALLINSNVVQVGDASSLRANPHNVRVLYSEYSRERGPIVVAGNDIARSVKTHGSLKYLRTYPGGPAYAPVTGYYSLVIGASGIEQAEDPILSGSDDRLFLHRIADEITGRTPRGGSVVLTLNPAAQQAAYQGLHGVKGAVVALDPSTGAILALATSPSYDPSALSSHNSRAINQSYKHLLNDPGNPLIDRAISQTYPPGSLFKIVTSSAAFGTHRFSPGSTIPTPTQLRLPQTNVFLHNFGGERCGNGSTDTIADSFRISCNTAFAGLGLKIGIHTLADQAKAFGIGSSLSIPLHVAASQFDFNANRPNTALSAIGQYDDALTPLQAAQIAAAIANRGAEMKPYLVSEVRGTNAEVLSRTKPQKLRQSVTPQVAQEVTSMMELVVRAGTGTAAQIPGITVAGKTGTAQHGLNSQHLPPEAWFVSFAPADNPKIAVAVLVEDGGSLGSDATGGAVAAPIAKSVMCAVLSC
ncbi:MAG TPA: penicillin-binding transpeptidase domain-containing protein [Mycobacteriales bacterium]|nr:penicillin-binding transpeptidase domain-containing protein [Mycobacteriales bacterium]